MDSLTQLREAIELCSNEAMLLNREFRSIHVRNASDSMKEAISELDKVIPKTVRKGELK